MFTASRILYGLGLRGLAPRWVSYCTKGGLPVAALAICVCGSFGGRLAGDSDEFCSLVLLPLVGLHGREERICAGFQVSFFRTVASR